MAKETRDEAFTKSDFQRTFQILNDEEDAAINISGWTLSWMVKRYTSQADGVAILTKTTAGGAITISGTWNTDPAVSTQVATLVITDTDTDTIPPGLYHYELKRMDAGFEVVLAYGPLVFVDGVHD